MNILGIQLVGVIFGIIFLYITFLHRKRKDVNETESIIWILIWGGLIFVSLVPHVLNVFVTDILNVSRTLDFIIIVGFFVLFSLMFYVFMLVKKTQNKVEKLVRNIALDEKKR